MLFLWLLLLVLPCFQSADFSNLEGLEILKYLEANVFPGMEDLSKYFVEEFMSETPLHHPESNPISFRKEPAKIEQIRSQIYQDLLEKVRLVLPRVQRVQWESIEVRGWPSSVLFYTSQWWNEDDCYVLLGAMKDIHFVRKIVAEEETVSFERKVALKRQVEQFFQKRFGTSKIRWAVLKANHPTLHLKNRDIVTYSAADFKSLNDALVALEASIDEKADSSTLENSASEEGKELISQLLLSKYRLTFRMARKILWSEVEVLGWPEDVIFYSKDRWTETEVASLLAAMDGIRFVSCTKRFPVITPELRKALLDRAKAFFFEQFNFPSIKWELLKKDMPSFHLTYQKPSHWTPKDVQMIQEAFRFFENKSPAVISKKRKLEDDEYC